MCGFAGFWTVAGQPKEALVERGERMCAALHHRGPDDGGTWADPAPGILLGSRRLAILDLSGAGHMPMASHCGRYVTAYNGEIYNFCEVRRELERKGHRFISNSDTEVLVNAWAAWGAEGSLKRLNGMFAFSVWDRQERTLTLARDRLGEKPVYYGWCRDTFVFASELKALQTHPSFRRELDLRSLALFLRLGYIPAPHTIYERIHKLLPGHFLKVGAPQREAAAEPYWSAKEVAEAGPDRCVRQDFRQATDALDALLRDSVRLRMVADVPVGAFLSGGLDSSLVVALMQAQRTSKVKTFTIGFEEQSHNEAHYAKDIAQHLGTEHSALLVSSQAACEVIPMLPDMYDEPFADPSQIPTFLVSQLAREAVTVSLSGDGGDELFGGYREYVLGVRRWKVLQRLSPVIRFLPQEATAFAAASGGRLQKVAQFVQLDSPEAVHRHHVSGWKRPTDLLSNAVEHETAFTEPDCWPDRISDAERMMYMDMVTYLPEDILTKLDRASMAVSLEARVPLLDHRVVEFAWRLPVDFKILDNEGKRILRAVIAQYLPIDLFKRRKMGFGFPLAHWLRGPLRPWAEELLSASKIREQGILNATPIGQAWKEHLDETRNRSTELWAILMFQAWQQRWG